jgi:hypothetical protein
MAALYPALLVAVGALDLDELRRLLRNRGNPEAV